MKKFNKSIVSAKSWRLSDVLLFAIRGGSGSPDAGAATVAVVDEMVNTGDDTITTGPAPGNSDDGIMLT